MNKISSKHTPGPWKIGKRDIDDNSLLVLGTENTKNNKCSHIARVEPRHCYNNDQEANARLIAAAPELFQELYNLLYTPENYITPEAHPAAVAVIAKVAQLKYRRV